MLMNNQSSAKGKLQTRLRIWSPQQRPHTLDGNCSLSRLGRERDGWCCSFTTVDLTLYRSVPSQWIGGSCDTPLNHVTSKIMWQRLNAWRKESHGSPDFCCQTKVKTKLLFMNDRHVHREHHCKYRATCFMTEVIRVWVASASTSTCLQLSKPELLP